MASVTGAAPGRRRACAPGAILARGRLVPADIDGFPGLGALAVERRVAARGEAGAAWHDVPGRRQRRPLHHEPVLLADGASRSRAPGARTLSDLDLSRVGATKADLARAQKAVDGGGLLVTGSVRLVPHAGPAGTGRTLRASQFWLRYAS